MTKAWRVAVVGCGAAAFGIHLPILAASHDFVITAVVDHDPARAEAAARRFGIPRVASDVRTAVREADMVVILTPEHEPLIDTALAAGRHVFTEKPVSLDAQETGRLVARAAANGLLLEVGAMRMYDPAVLALVEHAPCEAVTAGWLVKFDGADAVERADHLPDGFAPYTIDAPPGAGAYEWALRTLLWSGYHLLTVLALIAPDARVIGASVDPVRQRLLATLATTGDAPLTLVIGPGLPGEYHEDVQLLTKDDRAHAIFTPPYGPAAGSRFTSSPTGGRTGGSPFPRMWTEIARRLNGRPQHLDSGDVATVVEALAVRLATAATEHRTLPEMSAP